ncbi:MAG: hypothetical protein OEW45_19370 [Deltaproteobacteria bacterium]|nr:hypothetical protein [Deltaproteobacteria bacterium]
MDIILQNPAIANLPVVELENALSAFAVLVTVATLALAAQYPFPGVWGARHPKRSLAKVLHLLPKYGTME